MIRKVSARITETEPQLVKELLADGGTLLAEFAGTANKEGVDNLLNSALRLMHFISREMVMMVLQKTVLRCMLQPG